jgi:hypothetical protein
VINPHKDLHARRGTILVATLVCLLLTTALIGTMLHAALSHRRQLLTERDVRQTDLLVSSGIHRAKYRLTVQPDYRGEIWQPPLRQPAGNVTHPKVKIEIARAAKASAWRVQVSTENPVSPGQAIRRTRTVLLPVETTPFQESSP